MGTSSSCLGVQEPSGERAERGRTDTGASQTGSRGCGQGGQGSGTGSAGLEAGGGGAAERTAGPAGAGGCGGGECSLILSGVVLVADRCVPAVYHCEKPSVGRALIGRGQCQGGQRFNGEIVQLWCGLQ